MLIFHKFYNVELYKLKSNGQLFWMFAEECKVMGPLIDQELEQIDAAHNDLMNLNQKLADAFQLYTRLMQEGASAAQYAPVAPSGYAAPQMTSTMPTGRLPSQQQTLPIGVGAGAPNPYSSYNPYLELSQQPQVGTATPLVRS